MITAESVVPILATYSDHSDGAVLKSLELIHLLLACSPAPFSRDHFTPGHITCTGLVLSPGGDRILSVHHRRLDRWLLPGGHVEPSDLAIANAARREVVEETGAALAADSAVRLIGADVHGIPSNGREPYHLHHDLLFLFCATDEALSVSEESHAVLWIAPSEFDKYTIPGNVRRAYARALAHPLH